MFCDNLIDFFMFKRENSVKNNTQKFPPSKKSIKFANSKLTSDENRES